MAEKDSRVVGNARKGGVEVRYDRPGLKGLDEIVADGFAHLERMNDAEYALILTTKNERACFWITAQKGGRIKAMESWRAPVNHRSEAAKRRENARKRKAGQ